LITGNFPPFEGGKLAALAARVGLIRKKKNREIVTKPIKICLNAHLHLPGLKENP
jgi:hypothetical protein